VRRECAIAHRYSRKEHLMKKLTLKPEDLQVNSFQTAEQAQGTGTVHGHATYGQWTCGIWCPPSTNPANTGPCAC
jgi:hypothetical protein